MACLEQEMRRLHEIATGRCVNATVRAELTVFKDDGRSFWTVEVIDDDLPEEAIEGSASGGSESLVDAVAECVAQLDLMCWGTNPDGLAEA